MSAIKLSTPSSGSISLSPADTASNLTITVPAVTGTMNLVGPAFYATLGSEQVLSASTLTKLQFTSETFDTNSNFNTSTYRFTPTVAGYYQINLNQEYSPQTGVQSVQIQKNGSRIASGGAYASGTSTWMACCAVLCYLNGSTDYVEAYGYTNQSATAYSGSSSQFSGVLVRVA